MGLKYWFYMAQAVLAWWEGPYRTKIFTELRAVGSSLQCDSDLGRRMEGRGKKGSEILKRKRKRNVPDVNEIKLLIDIFANPKLQDQNGKNVGHSGVASESRTPRFGGPKDVCICPRFLLELDKTKTQPK